jgi:hypothetical protein
MTNRDTVLAVQSSLTDRDLRLLSWLYDHGVLTTPQITRALFTSTTFGQRRLLRLLHLRLVARFRPQRPDGGSFPYHWVLDQPGVEVIAAQRGDQLPRAGQAKARRHHLTHRANLAHLLGVNGFFTDLATHQRTHPGSGLDRWWPASRFHDKGAFYQAGDPPDVILHTTRLRPDGHGIWSEDGWSVPFYLEYDTATEPLGTLIDKIDRYRTLWLYTERLWPALFVVPTGRRELHLHQRIGDRFGPALLPVATAASDHLTRSGLSPAEEVWWPYGQPGLRRRLRDLIGGHPTDTDTTDTDDDLDPDTAIPDTEGDPRPAHH